MFEYIAQIKQKAQHDLECELTFEDSRYIEAYVLFGGDEFAKMCKQFSPIDGLKCLDHLTLMVENAIYRQMVKTYLNKMKLDSVNQMPRPMIFIDNCLAQFQDLEQAWQRVNEVVNRLHNLTDEKILALLTNES